MRKVTFVCGTLHYNHLEPEPEAEPEAEYEPEPEPDYEPEPEPEPEYEPEPEPEPEYEPEPEPEPEEGACIVMPLIKIHTRYEQCQTMTTPLFV